MIESVTVTNERDETIVIPLREPDKTGLAIRSIDGLGPAKANINLTELATIDGAMVNSTRIATRNIVVDLVYFPNPTIEDSRLISYKYFTIKRKITFEIKTKNRKCKTIGVVESIEPNIFDRMESCKISILCADPYFYSDDIVTSFYGVIPKFEFPFKNNSVSKKLLNMGEIELLTEKIIYYDGDADTGIIIHVKALGPATKLYFYNEATREIIRINEETLRKIVGSGIQRGDEIEINTNKGQKRAIFTRELKEYSIMNALERPFDWIRIVKGYNLFMCNSETGVEYLRITITNRILYEGV